MSSLTDVLDGFVKGLKKTGEFSHVRFVFAGRKDFAEMPVESFLVACGVGKTEALRDGSQCEIRRADFEFTVYAPHRESKRNLTLLSQKIAETLKAQDKNGDFVSITVSDGSFDSNLTVWKQKITALYEGMQTTSSEGSVYLGKEKLSGVVSFEVKQENTSYELKELLFGGTEEYINLKSRYTITLVLQGNTLPATYSYGVHNLYRASTDTTYDDCRVLKIHSKADGRQEITLESFRAHKGAEVTV